MSKAARDLPAALTELSGLASAAVVVQLQSDGRQFQSVWFVESIVTQTLIIHAIRTRRIPFLESRASVPLTVMSLLVCLIGMYLPYSLLAGALGFVPLPPAYWACLAATVVGYLLLTHVTKTWFHSRFGIG